MNRGGKTQLWKKRSKSARSREERKGGKRRRKEEKMSEWRVGRDIKEMD